MHAPKITRHGRTVFGRRGCDLPCMDINWLNLPSPLAVVALRTSPKHHSEVSELAVLRLAPGRPVEALESRVAQTHVPSGPPAFVHLVPRLRRLLGGAIVVAHEAASVNDVLDYEFDRLGARWAAPTLCTRRLARRVLPGRSTALAVPMGPSCMEQATATARMLGHLATNPQQVRSCVRTPNEPAVWPNIWASLVPPWPARVSAERGGAAAPGLQPPR